MAILLVFLALQFADLGTTLVFLQRGVGEANPLVAALIRVSGQPALAVLLVKAAGCLMAAYAWRSRRTRLLRHINVFFALCVAWNLLVIASV
jgi:Domain of unknown function (DUF5658)